MPQPNFDVPAIAGPSMVNAIAGPSRVNAIAGPSRVNWQERLEQGFQTRHAQRLQNRGSRRREQSVEMPMAAGPSAPIEGRANWQESFDQGFQSRHAQRLQNRGGPSRNQNNAPPQQFIMGQQHRYAEEERQHTAHRLNTQMQRQMDHDREALEHQAHMAEVQQQHEHQREVEALQHQAHLAELQRQHDHQREVEVLQHQAHLAEVQRQREIEVLDHQAHLNELRQEQEDQRQQDHDRDALQHQDHLNELRQQEEDQRQMDYDQEALQHENDVAQQQQMEHQAEAEQVQAAVNEIQALRAIPKGCRPYQEPQLRFSLGPMSVQCPHCQAVHFKSEKLANSSNIRPKFGVCCLQGQIQLPPISEPPQLLHHLLNSATPRAQKFRENIHQYNCAFTFTSVAVNIDQTVLNGCGPYSFRMHGGLYHSMGTLHPQEGQSPRYAQLYIYDQQAALAARNGNNLNLDHVLMADIQEMMDTNNPLVPLYKQAYQIMRESPPDLWNEMCVSIVLQPGEDHCRYNLPTVNEVAAVIPGSVEEDVDEHRGIVLCYKNGGLQRISHIHPLYTLLHYVLLFPKGDTG